MSTTTAKFGGTSIADAAHFRKIGEIVAKDPARRFLVVSAPGKRNPSDLKVTDLLLSVYEKAAAEENGYELFVPPLKLCGDNGAMIGARGYYEYLAGVRAGSDLNAYATMDL